MALTHWSRYFQTQKVKVSLSFHVFLPDPQLCKLRVRGGHYRNIAEVPPLVLLPLYLMCYRENQRNKPPWQEGQRSAFQLHSCLHFPTFEKQLFE